MRFLKTPTSPHLRLHRARLGLSPAAAGAAEGVAGAGRLPGALPGGAVEVEVPAAQVLVGLPVPEHVQRGGGRDGRQAGLGDLQLLEVGVDRRVGAALARGRRRLGGEKREKKVRTRPGVESF